MKAPLIFNYVCPACLPFHSLLLPEARLFASLSHIATGLQRYINPHLTVSLVFFFSVKPCVHAKSCPLFTMVALRM